MVSVFGSAGAGAPSGGATVPGGAPRTGAGASVGPGVSEGNGLGGGCSAVTLLSDGNTAGGSSVVSGKLFGGNGPPVFCRLSGPAGGPENGAVVTPPVFGGRPAVVFFCSFLFWSGAVLFFARSAVPF